MRLSIAVDGHGEIAALAQRPVGKLLSGFAIHHRDRMRAGEVDKDAVALRLELEAFGMGFERHILDLAAARWIDDGQSSVAVANDDPLGRRINTDIVSIAAELNLPCRRVRITFE